MKPFTENLRRQPLLSFLRDELAPYQGRGATTLRITVCCMVTVAIAMLFRIPLPTYMAYIVFQASGAEMATTLVTAIGGIVAVTLAVGLTLLFYVFDAAEPALRLPLMAASAFLGMYSLRVLTLGPITFLASFVLVLSQTLIDDIPSLEQLTRLVLWLWVIVTVPAVVTLLANLATGQSATTLTRQKALGLLDRASAALRENHPIDVGAWQAEAVELIALRQRASMLDSSLRSRAAADTRSLSGLIDLLTLMPLLSADMPSGVRQALAEACARCGQALASPVAVPTRHPTLSAAMVASIPVGQRAFAMAMSDTLDRLAKTIADRWHAEAMPDATPGKRKLFVPDAFTNPEHVRFALKATLAVMMAYLTYTLLDWPGIRTAVTTCFFVAMGSVGETVHKLTLRITGAVIGGLAAAFCIVFVLPSMTDIGQLCLVIGVFAAVFAWISTSTDRLAYAGLQMAFAFFLGVLHDYAPSTELVELRDRVAGIILGNIIISLVFTSLWPSSTRDAIRSALSRAMRAIGHVIQNPIAAPTDARLQAAMSLVNARRLLSLAIFESPVLPAQLAAREPEVAVLANTRRLAAAALVVSSVQPPSGATHDEGTGEALAWLDAAATRIEQGEPLPSAPRRHPALAHTSPESALHEARNLLQTEIEHAAANAV
ncbi:MAG TPA: FUSC family protein [Dyella sp.]